MNGEYIICSAIWYHDLDRKVTQRGMHPTNTDHGIVVCGWRHGNVIITVNELINLRSVRYAKDGVGKMTQGFLTNKNRFVDRKEAGKIALDCGQIKEETDCLFSEDLY